MRWTNKCKPFRDEALRCFEKHWSTVTELDEDQCAALREEFCRRYMCEHSTIFEQHFERDSIKLARLLGIKTTRDRKQLIASSPKDTVRARYYMPCSDRPIGFELEGDGVRVADLFVLHDDSFAIITTGKQTFALLHFHHMTIGRFESK